MVDGPEWAVGCKVDRGGVVAAHLDRGLPGWAEPQERPRTGRGMGADSLV